MIKADLRPWKETLEQIVYPALFFTLAFWIVRDTPLWEALLGNCGWVLILGYIASFRTFKKLRRAEQRRQAAVTVPLWIPLAVPQPVADPAALPLPFVISSKPGRLAGFIGLSVLWIIILGVLTLFVWGFKGSYIPTLLFSVVFTVPISILGTLLSYTWIEIRDEGLTLRTLFWRRTILWQEARLFAIDATVETNKSPDKYELSSATTILRWSRDMKPSRMTRLSPPFPEYAWYMDALLAVVAGKTGLPLYDLRDWQLPPLPAPPEPMYPNLWRGE